MAFVNAAIRASTAIRAITWSNFCPTVSAAVRANIFLAVDRILSYT